MFPVAAGSGRRDRLSSDDPGRVDAPETGYQEPTLAIISVF